MVHPDSCHSTDPDIAQTAALIGDPVRAKMLLALLDGGELPACELAFRSGSSAQSASAHLGKLVEGGLLTMRPSGRHRLFVLASADVAHALERLTLVAKPARIVALPQSESMHRLREARSCYDHLAGRIGVMLTEQFMDRKALELRGDSLAGVPGLLQGTAQYVAGQQPGQPARFLQRLQ